MGTMGLNIMYDQHNKLILLANPSRYGEISYVKATQPTQDARSLHSHNELHNNKFLTDINNIGKTDYYLFEDNI